VISLQFGQSFGEADFRHSSGEQPQSAHFIRFVSRPFNGPSLTLLRVENHDECDNERNHDNASEDAYYGRPEESDCSDANDSIDVLPRERHDASVVGTVLNNSGQRSLPQMLFITLYKFRKKLTKADIEKANRAFSSVKSIGVWWTLGRFDAVRVFEAKDEKEAMKISLALEESASAETMVALDRAEAVKLLS